jgi:hypothetical protein
MPAAIQVFFGALLGKLSLEAGKPPDDVEAM